MYTSIEISISDKAFEEASTTVWGESLFHAAALFHIFSTTGERLKLSLYAGLIFWKWSVFQIFALKWWLEQLFRQSTIALLHIDLRGWLYQTV